MGHVQITHDKRSLIIHVPRWAYDKYPIHWRQTLAWSRDGDVLHVEIGDGAQGDIRRKTYHKYQTVYLTIPAKYARDLELRNGDHVRCTWREEPRLRLSIYKDEAPLSRYKKHKIEREEARNEKLLAYVKEENDKLKATLAEVVPELEKYKTELARRDFKQAHPDWKWEFKTVESGKETASNQLEYKRIHGREATPADMKIMDVKYGGKERKVIMADRKIMNVRYGGKEGKMTLADMVIRSPWLRAEYKNLDEEDFIISVDEWWEFLQGLTEEETDALDRREFKGRYWRRAERYEAFGMRWIVNPYFALHVLWNVGRLPGTYYQQTAYLKHAFERYEKDPQSYEGIDDYVREYKEFARVIQRPLWNVYNLVRFMASHRSEACSTTRAYDDFPDTDENGEPWPDLLSIALSRPVDFSQRKSRPRRRSG